MSSIPLSPQAQILQPEQTISVPAGAGSGAHISVPGHGVFSIDFSVQGGRQLLLMVLTNQQYSAIAAGRQASGNPLVRVTISGTASQTIVLEPGEYFIFLGNDATTNTQITYRATWQPT